MAEVDDKGAVTVEGHPVGRLEGFRFRADRADNPDEARTLRQAAAQALAPQFHLRADRFYNAPDTEIDFTEQGGLMWGEHAVGRLSKGPDALRPDVVAFVDEEAAPEVAQKVHRRLQHFIDRKVAAAMEPLLLLARDETLTGLARGFAYRLVENLGIIPRGDVAEEVKQLDPEARTALRRHGIRLGQFTVFQPALLKPAPTRLRLVLWSLWKGLDEFPSSPPPGHVTVPATPGAPQGFWAMAGYRAAGERAIRIDMLERLADLLRDRDSRAGFEAAPDMLSITGLSLEQFARLMEGLGYQAERAERPKVRSAKTGGKPKASAVATAMDPVPSPEPAVAGVVASGDAPEPGTPQEVPPEPPVEEPVRTPEEAPPQPPTEDPAPIPEAPPGEPAEVPPQPDLPGEPSPPPEVPQEIPVQDPPEEPGTAPIELPTREPSEMPDIMPSEMPDITPAEIPMDTPMEMPGSPYASGPEAQASPDAIAVGPEAPDASAVPTETEVYFTFTWAGRGQRRQGGDQRRGEARGPRREGRAESPGGERPQGERSGERRGPPRSARYSPVVQAEGAAAPAEGQPAAQPDARPDRGERRFEGKRPDRAGGRGERDGRPPRGPRSDRQERSDRPDRNRPQSFEAAPPRDDPRAKRIDPDNPFAAALAGFKPK